jgi:hypothetical protein
MLFEFYLSSLCTIYFWAAQKHLRGEDNSVYIE